MWHSPASEPLSSDERKRAFHLQIYCRAHKVCAVCSERLSVAHFASYGDLVCRLCRAAGFTAESIVTRWAAA